MYTLFYLTIFFCFALVPLTFLVLVVIGIVAGIREYKQRRIDTMVTLDYSDLADAPPHPDDPGTPI